MRFERLLLRSLLRSYEAYARERIRQSEKLQEAVRQWMKTL